MHQAKSAPQNSWMVGPSPTMTNGAKVRRRLVPLDLEIADLLGALEDQAAFVRQPAFLQRHALGAVIGIAGAATGVGRPGGDLGAVRDADLVAGRVDREEAVVAA